MRRYFVVNGFDGALTMLGLIMGFLVNAPELSIMLNACLGAAIALGVSGVSSAYISEVAERRRELEKLEEAMVADMKGSAHAAAVSWVPLLVALINGMAPLLISMMIMSPLILVRFGVALPISPLYLAIIIAALLVFFLGAFLGKVASISWLASGIRTLLIAFGTAARIYLFAGF